ncbi:hypothetical protein KC19_4G251300 [Ceratodon purpureus]|uniref:Uncharacterized protein n=1 Tax=Ceratodon purpureus TaxID=3225 RepID=A0A8T0IEJ3_CERPU|nr:hypothetical protein KC19_4G251300 [Ceratodon purpureus]
MWMMWESPCLALNLPLALQITAVINGSPQLFPRSSLCWNPNLKSKNICPVSAEMHDDNTQSPKIGWPTQVKMSKPHIHLALSHPTCLQLETRYRLQHFRWLPTVAWPLQSRHPGFLLSFTLSVQLFLRACLALSAGISDSVGV